MALKLSLAGEKFGRLLVIRPLPNKGRDTVWLCLCCCGNFSHVATRELRKGDTKSCGCLYRRRKLGSFYSKPAFGKKNSNWKGDLVGYAALHKWVKKRLIKPAICDVCNENKALDLANISQKYKRDLSDWEWLCRRCHMTKDGRLNNLIEISKKRKRDAIICNDCRQEKKHFGHGLCMACHRRQWRKQKSLSVI